MPSAAVAQCQEDGDGGEAKPNRQATNACPNEDATAPGEMPGVRKMFPAPRAPRVPNVR